jgi:uncharacterized protein (TIGR02678 family)
LTEAVYTEERQRAIRLLLAQPLVSDAGPDPETFALLRRDAPWLRRWFSDHLGYRLVVEPDLARLHKRPVPGRLLRPARSRTGRPFDPRRYCLLCLALSALERLEVQTVLSELAAQVELLARSEEGLEPFDLNRYSERLAFVDAVRLLVDLGVLEAVAGDEQGFTKGRADADALYDVHRRRLSQLLVAEVPPSLVSDAEELAQETYPDTDEGVNRRLRHRLLRRLLEEPVLYLADLEAAELAYLQSQRHRLVRLATDATGLEVEVRREGLALLDAGGVLTDETFPASGTAAHAALLLGEFLTGSARGSGRDEAPTAVDRTTVPRAAIRTELEALRRRYGRSWAKQYRDDDGLDRLLHEALERLAAMGLVREHPEGVEPLPALARFTSEDAAAAAEADHG